MRRFCASATIALFVCMLSVSVAAQVGTSGQVVGSVKDSTGGVIAKADLVLTDAKTGATFKAASSDDGGFVFPNLQPGTYTLKASAKGFQPLTLQTIIVQTSRSTDVTVQFQVAGVSEQVDVVARTPVVETTSTTVASTVQTEQIAKLPLAGRNILDFALLV